jgi:hypothetical protein
MYSYFIFYCVLYIDFDFDYDFILLINYGMYLLKHLLNPILVNFYPLILKLKIIKIINTQNLRYITFYLI